jgi:hypothetical protein
VGADHGTYELSYSLVDDPTVSIPLRILVDNGNAPRILGDAAVVQLGQNTPVDLRVLENDLGFLDPKVIDVTVSDPALAPLFSIPSDDVVRFTPSDVLLDAKFDRYVRGSSDFFTIPAEYVVEGSDGFRNSERISILVLRPTTRFPAHPNSTDASVRSGYDPITGYGRVNGPAAIPEVERIFGIETAPDNTPTPVNAEEAQPVSVRELLTDLPITVSSAITTEQITQMLTGQTASIGDLLRFQFVTDPAEYAPARAEFDLDLAGIGKLADLGLTGPLAAAILPRFQIDLGIDSQGLFLGSETRLDTQITGSATAAGSLLGFGLLADGAIDAATQQELVESFIARVGAS